MSYTAVFLGQHCGLLLSDGKVQYEGGVDSTVDSIKSGCFQSAESNQLNLGNWWTE
uniref:Uncharacterized protein n=1 Tax=Anguilla anguilla TaxID=7936 RepID=A0A0E9QDQ9_ANGAN